MNHRKTKTWKQRGKEGGKDHASAMKWFNKGPTPYHEQSGRHVTRSGVGPPLTEAEVNDRWLRRADRQAREEGLCGMVAWIEDRVDFWFRNQVIKKRVGMDPDDAVGLGHCVAATIFGPEGADGVPKEVRDGGIACLILDVLNMRLIDFIADKRDLADKEASNTLASRNIINAAWQVSDEGLADLRDLLWELCPEIGDNPRAGKSCSVAARRKRPTLSWPPNLASANTASAKRCGSGGSVTRRPARDCKDNFWNSRRLHCLNRVRYL